MGLKDLRLPTETVKLPGGESFAVRGLHTLDIAHLIRRHQGAMEGLFAKFASDTEGDVTAAGAAFLKTAPALAAEVIALASGELDGASEMDAAAIVANASRLPVAAQLDALEKIVTLTFDGEGGPKKAIETVIKAIRGATDMMVDLRLSGIGSEASDAR